MTTATPAARHIEYMRLPDVPAAARNPKKHDKAKIRASIERFGLTSAGLLDERTSRLVAGHGRLEVLRDMRASGVAPPAGVTADDDGEWLVPIVRGWASSNDEEAQGYLIIDNRSSELGGWDNKVLSEVLDELVDYNVDLLELSGYTQVDLDQLLRESGALADRTSNYFDNAFTRDLPSDEEEDEDDGDEGADDADKGGPPHEGELEFVQVSWIVNTDQRKTIRTALSRAQKLFELDTSAMALHAVAERFLAIHPEEKKP